jgi:hypothetical protein
MLPNWAPTPPSTPLKQQSRSERAAILHAVNALMTFGHADAIADDTLPRIELARKLLKEID